MAKAGEHLTYYERELTAEFRPAGRGLGYTAEIWERVKSTISSGLRRNSRDGRYNPAIAEALARERASKARAASKMDYPEIRERVGCGLRKRWFPEQISGDPFTLKCT